MSALIADVADISEQRAVCSLEPYITDLIHIVAEFADCVISDSSFNINYNRTGISFFGIAGGLMWL